MRNLEPILLVDDRQDNVGALKLALTELGVANRLIHCAEQRTALDYLRVTDGTRPCLALVNASMPDNRGLEFLRAVKSDDQTKHVPVVVLVDRETDPAVNASFDLGAAGCLVKASTHKELLRTLQTVCRYWTLSEMVCGAPKSS